MSIKDKIPQDASLYMKLLHQQHKVPICIIKRGDTQKQKFVQIEVFAIIFVTGVRKTKKHFSSVFKPQI